MNKFGLYDSSFVRKTVYSKINFNDKTTWYTPCSLTPPESNDGGEVLKYESLSINSRDIYTIVGLCPNIRAQHVQPTKYCCLEEDLLWARQTFPDFDTKRYPPRGGIHEIESLYATARSKGDWYSMKKPQIDMDVILCELDRERLAYAGQPRPRAHDLSYGDFVDMFREIFTGILSEFNNESSPGYPYQVNKQSQTNRYFNHNPVHLLDMCWSRLCDLKEKANRKYSNGRWILLDLLRRDLTMEEIFEFSAISDPVNCFIKKEPHSLKKLQSKRTRLVKAPSIVDRTVKQYLTKKLDKLMSDNAIKSQNMSGLKWPEPECVAEFAKIVKEWGGCGSSDNENYDVTVHRVWMILDCVMRCMHTLPKEETDEYAGERWYGVIEILLDHPVNGEYYRTMFMELVIKMSPLLVTGSGIVIVQNVAGEQRSGDGTTTTTNGRIRRLADLQAFKNLSMDFESMQGRSNGDDNITMYKDKNGKTFTLEQYVQAHKDLGFTIKEMTFSDKTFEINSSVVTMDGEYTFLNKVKTTHAILARDPKSITKSDVDEYLKNVPEGKTMPFIIKMSTTTPGISRRDDKPTANNE